MSGTAPTATGSRRRVIILGAGPMGLAAAYEAVKRGYEVDVLEAGDVPGGMAAHFDFDGLSIERFYHFCCLSDTHTLALLEELDLGDAMQWVTTRMGFHLEGRLIDWGHPVALIKAPGIDFLTKLRYGLLAFTATRRSRWQHLDAISAERWITAWLGEKAYDRLWRPLMALKFHEYADKVSAAWIWQRMKRLGNSRASLFEERLGYIEGGSETLISALVKAIEAKGGRIHCANAATRFLIKDGAIEGVETARGQTFHAGQVISTIPTPYIPALFDDAQAALRAPYERIANIGVVCVILKLKRSVSGNFWVNISDPEIGVPGFVEFSRLRPVLDTIVYVPWYMPHTNENFTREDDWFIARCLEYLGKVNPDITPDDLIAAHVGRLKHAQPVCKTGFAQLIPDPVTPIAGLQIADTSFYYPEDRGVSESIRYAKHLAGNL